MVIDMKSNNLLFQKCENELETFGANAKSSISVPHSVRYGYWWYCQGRIETEQDLQVRTLETLLVYQYPNAGTEPELNITKK